jgi:hypothetical protein
MGSCARGGGSPGDLALAQHDHAGGHEQAADDGRVEDRRDGQPDAELQQLLELMLLAEMFAPGRTQAVAVRIRTRMRAWLASHGRQVAVIGLAAVGILLSVTGLITIG